MGINEFVEMTIFLCLICFSIYEKMQGFIYESGLFILFYYYFFFTLRRNSFHALSCSVSEISTFLHITQKFKMAAKSGGKTIFGISRQ